MFLYPGTDKSADKNSAGRNFTVFILSAARSRQRNGFCQREWCSFSA